MRPAAFLAECERRGVRLTVAAGAGGTPVLRVKAPAPQPSGVVEYLRRHKPLLIELLAERSGKPEVCPQEAPPPPSPPLRAPATEYVECLPSEGEGQATEEELTALAAAVLGDARGGWDARPGSALVWTQEKAGRELLWYVRAAPAPGVLGGGITRRAALEDLAGTVAVHPDAAPEQAAEVLAVVTEELERLGALEPAGWAASFPEQPRKPAPA